MEIHPKALEGKEVVGSGCELPLPLVQTPGRRCLLLQDVSEGPPKQELLDEAAEPSPPCASPQAHTGPRSTCL